MSHACRVICALPPLDAALTKKNTQHDTCKVLRLAGGLIGTYTESGGRLRTVANGCGWLLTLANSGATSSEHTLNPQTARVKREPLLSYALEKNTI